ncbi:MAG: sulfatase-like hydrolase/transferase [Thermoanaerobaculia bacterium]|nr:sulfatase-like hydrolase/transferase [Thermoanaerobaculia bacterium]
MIWCRRMGWGFAWLCTLAGLVGCGPSERADDGVCTGCDVILITVDTLRADAVGVYGPIAGQTPTPKIDELARRGLVFTQAVAPMPRTTPSLASLLSGRSPKHHGSREVGQVLADDVPLLAEVLRRVDVFRSTGSGPYLTVGVTGNRAAAAPQGLDRGFDAFHLVPGDKPSAEEVTDAALRLLRGTLLPQAETGSSRPLFLWVHYVDPHFPYTPPGFEPDACTDAMQVYERNAAFVFVDQDGVSSRALEDCARRYHAEVARADREIRRLLEGLHEMGRPVEQSLLVFTSDHGENLGEDGLFYEHGPSLHDASIRIPLIVTGPGLEPGRKDGVVELQDVMPTLLTMVGVRPDAWPPMDGRDLADSWLGSRRESEGQDQDIVAFAESNSSLHIRVWNAVVAGRFDRHCVHRGRWSLCGSEDDLDAFQLFDHEADPMLEKDLTPQHPEVVERLRRQREQWPPETARARAVRGPRFKLVETPDPAGGYVRRLFDLLEDPEETRDVSTKHAEVAAVLGRLLDEYVADLPAPGQVARDEEDLRALRALGYIE